MITTPKSTPSAAIAVHTHNVAETFSVLNNSDTFQKLLQSGYNIIDHDNGNFHYFTLSDYELSEILCNIRNASHKSEKVLTYYLASNNAICFKIQGIEEVMAQSMYIYDLSLMPVLEYVLGISITPDGKTLRWVNKRSFGVRKAKRLRDCGNTEETTIIWLSQESKRIRVVTKTLEAFQTGLTHINHLISSSPELQWLQESKSPRQAVLYKDFSIPFHNFIELMLYSVNGGLRVPEYTISLEVGGMLVGTINRAIRNNPGAENEELLKMLNVLNRAQRISDILI